MSKNRPSLAEAIADRMAAQSHRDTHDDERAGGIDLTGDVRRLAEQVDAHPELLGALNKDQRRQVTTYRTWRAVREDQTTDTTGESA